MKNSESKIDFTASLKELEAITEWFESEDVDLDQALIKFERGMELSNLLKNHLNQVENKVETIKKKFSTPEIVLSDEFTEADPEPDLFSNS